MGSSILGLDIGGTKTAVIVGNSKADILYRKQFDTIPSRSFPTYFEELTDEIEKVLALQEFNIDAISVSIGGPLDVMNGIIKSPPNLPTWVNIQLKKILSERFNLPAYIEHDGNAGALAEYYFGAGKNYKSIIFLTLGTGFGAGIILDGKLYRGASYTAGEIGHIKISNTGPFAYGKYGSFESFCSGAGIANLAKVMFPKYWNQNLTTQELSCSAKQGDIKAIEVLNTAGYYLGRSFAILADLLNPECIILGGLGFRIGDLLLKPALEEFEKEALTESFSVCKIVPAQLKEKIGDAASLCAAIDQGNMVCTQ